LTMRSGLDCDDWRKDSPGHEDKMYRKRDWLAFWAAVPMRDAPGERFSYCTGNAIALGRIIEHASGKPFSVFASEALFVPLGIENARWATWNRGNRTDSGGHLRLTPHDLARIGQLLLDRGRIGERQIVSEAWLDAMTAEHAQVPGQSQRYGYLWWVDRTTSPNLPQTRLWMAWGNGGNFLIVMPELDAVVVFTGTRYNRLNALEPLLWLRDRLMPALRPPPTAP
jgi:CubicO group peptidase (beta-lactamase class C family)